MARNKTFRPDWVSAPGDTISDILVERNLSIGDFSEQTGYALEDVAALIQGRATITIAVARRLQDTLGASVEFWMSRDFQYREDVARGRQADEKWIKELPLGDMIKFGWLPMAPHPTEEVNACLEFFDVPSICAWRKKYLTLQESLFRTSPSFDSQPAAVAAWLRQGEIEAAENDCEPWDPGRFRESLSAIRALTRKKLPRVFIPELREICAACGVAVAVVRAPTGCRASGATRFLSPHKALLLLSFRYLTDDHFWFTFFHEAGHLLLHSEKGLFLEGIDAPLTSEEEEANRFAAHTLVPSERQPEMQALPLNGRKVIKFARKIGVSPGIVVGQLQHLGKLKYNQLNSLKRRYTWAGHTKLI